ncbi:MAG: hypothetical protein NXH70_05105 [Hyphomonas sp.]|nr:hypothetical protein [Hyphomonas sp.]
MKKKHWLSGAMAAALLTACTQNSDTPQTPDTPVGQTIESSAVIANFSAVLDEKLTVEDAGEANLSGVVSVLPDYASLSWDSQSFDAVSGATQFENLAFGFGSDPQFGLLFETATVWGLETDLLEARLAGERLSESGALFTRLEGTNVSYFGVTQAFNGLFDMILEGAGEELPEGMELAFDEFESNTERMVMTGVSLRPWELVPLSQEALSGLDEEIPPEALSFVHFGQQMIAVSRSIAIDKSVSSGTVANLKMRQPGAEWSADFEIGLVGADNIQGFDVGTYLVQDYTGNQTSAYSSATLPGEVVTMSGFPAGFSLAQSESYGMSAVTNLRLDKAMGYLARSELPGMDERDLLSLGRWDLTDYRAQLNDREIITAESAYFHADSFEWVIPSDLSFGMKGANLNTGEITGFVQILLEVFMDQSASDDLGETEQAEMDLVREGIQKAIDLMPEHGLDKIPFDVVFRSTWDADGGPADFSGVFDADGFSKTEFELGLTLPDYAAVQAAYEAEDQEAAFEESFENMFAFRGARYSEQDKGGYDKLFGFAHSLGKEYPDQGWGAMLGNMEPPQLRAYLGTMMRMGKASAAAEFPPAADWLESYASFLESGGTFEFASNPPQPINKAFIDAQGDEDPEPEEIVEIFGLTVTHTK